MDGCLVLMVKLEGSGCKSSLDTGVMVVGGLVTACGGFTGAESGHVSWLGVSIGGLCEPTHRVCLWPCLCTRPFLWCSFHSKKQTPQVPLAFWGRLEEVGVTNGVDCMLRRLRVAENFSTEVASLSSRRFVRRSVVCRGLHDKDVEVYKCRW